MTNPELVIFGAALAPLALAMASLVAARVWRQNHRRRFEHEARSGLVRRLGFRSVSRRTLSSHLHGRQVSVTFGLAEETGWQQSKSSALVAASRWDPDELGAPARRASATIEVQCASPLADDELLVEMRPPVVLRGRRDFAFALLEFPLRTSLREAERVQFADGIVRVTTCHARRPDAFIELVRTVVSAAEHLEQDPKATVEPRLIDEALHCLVVEFRLRAIALLVEFYPTPLTQSTLLRLSTDSDAVICLTAARALGADGIPRLTELAQGTRVAPTVRSAAIEALAERPLGEIGLLLERLMSDPNPDVATVALKRLGERGGAQMFGAIKDAVLSSRAPESLVMAGIAYLESLSFELAIDPLRHLCSHQSQRVQCAAIDVVGRRGDLSHLQDLTAQLRRLNSPPNVQMSLETAIALIRSRHHAGGGRLSISAPSTGISLGALSAPKVSGLAVASPSTGTNKKTPDTEVPGAE